MPNAPTVIVKTNKVWTNWHETVRQKVASYVTIWNANPNVASIADYNATTVVLQKQIADALKRKLEIRAAGGTWSFSPVAATDGILINTQPLNYRFWPEPADLTSEWADRAESLVFAQCGMSIAELNEALQGRGRSLKTSGASNGQTIAGAIATGTHGSAIREGAIHDSVVGLHIVTGPDRHVWLERKTDSVVSDAWLAKLGAERLPDDEVFKAALVSLGCFGIVHGVMLESAEAFWLRAYRGTYQGNDPWEVISQFDFSQVAPHPGVEPYFFQSIFKPYASNSPPCFTLMYATANRPSGPAPERHDKWRPGDGAAEVVANITDLAGGTPKFLAEYLFKQMCPDIDGTCGRWGDMFWDTSTRGKSAGMAIGLPLANAQEAVEALQALNKSYKIPGILALRFVQSSEATLAFTRHAPVTCVLDIDGTLSKKMKDFQEAAWKELQSMGIPFTFHWGKLMPAEPGLVEQMYGQGTVEDWRKGCAAILPDPAARGLFQCGAVRGLGIDP